MTAKEYLNQARMLDMLINAKREELTQLRQKATSISSPQWGDKVQSNGENTSMYIVDKIIKLENVINQEVNILVDLKAEIRDKIAKVYNPKFISLLTDKYINGFSLEKIAERNDISYETIKGWHGEALQIFRKENNMT